MTAPTPQRAASVEEREALDATEIANRIALLYNPQPDMSGQQINRLHGRQRRLVEDLAAEIADRITAAEARAEEAEAKNREFHRRLQSVEGPILSRATKAEFNAAFWKAARIRVGKRVYGLTRAADAATTDRDRLADEVARLRSALKPFTAETATGIYCFPGPNGRGFTVEMGWAFDAARALTATGGTTDGNQ